jgi:hypothetical protein
MTTTDVIALAAFGLSVLSFGWTVGWSVWLYMRPPRRHLTINTNTSFVVTPTTGGVETGPTFLSLRVTNTGAVPLTLSDCVVHIYRLGRWRRASKVAHPQQWQFSGQRQAHLQPGEAVEFPPVPLEALRGALRESFGTDRLHIGVTVIDSAGQKYRAHYGRMS